jgi:quercetin dioxygenase-like cupin family protein
MEALPMGQVKEAPRTHIQSEVVAGRAGYRILRLKIPEGEGLPMHSNVQETAIVVVSGEGEITVDDQVFPAEPGTVVEIAPGRKHAVRAEQNLEIVMLQV